jgi:hypothetical protein
VLLGDALRALAGTLAAALPLALAHPPRWLAVLLGVLLALFVSYLLVSLRRAGSCYLLDEAGIAVVPGGATITWSALDMLRLDYYSTRRDGRCGWFELRLRSGGRALRVDSRLPGFEAVLARALQAAAQRALALAPATRANLHALGMRGAQAPR